MSARIPDLEEQARRQERARLAISLVEQTRRLIEMAEAPGKREVVERLREVLTDAETVATLLARGGTNSKQRQTRMRSPYSAEPRFQMAAKPAAAKKNARS